MILVCDGSGAACSMLVEEITSITLSTQHIDAGDELPTEVTAQRNQANRFKNVIPLSVVIFSVVNIYRIMLVLHTVCF